MAWQKLQNQIPVAVLVFVQELDLVVQVLVQVLVLGAVLPLYF
ncbi:MAG TPA: hypothetical protein PLJ33_06430 [Peptococcaceae bacterium]|nr:hypothetical protein [Peptococcaceae bacterium]HPZ71182.1 hypothetical protein [Peptococcaceae bacterium]HQD54471.1 hypothetical protein [Peptococcaceae bacterium]